MCVEGVEMNVQQKESTVRWINKKGREEMR